MAEGWSDWIMHDGLAVPVAPGTLCQVETKCGDVIEDTSHAPLPPGHASMWVWAQIPGMWWFMAISRYRVRELRALTELRALVADPYSVPASRELVEA